MSGARFLGADKAAEAASLTEIAQRYLSVTDISLQSVAEGLAQHRAKMEALQMKEAEPQAIVAPDLVN